MRSTTKRIRVLLADDHAAVRSTVRADLEQAGFEVCAEADDAHSALIAALRERPDACLLDVRMPGGGIVAAWDISEWLPMTTIVMLSVTKNEEHVVAALRAGAVGYILKDIEGPQLARQVRAHLAGESTISPELAKRLLDLPPMRSERRRLLRRETDVRSIDIRGDRKLLELLRDGLTPVEITERLGVSEAVFRARLDATLRTVRFRDRPIAALSSLNT